MSEDIRKMIDKVKNFKRFVNENVDDISHLSSQQLEKEFKRLNNQYKMIDNEMNKIAKTQDTWEFEQKLDNIQSRMSKISTELEKRGF